MKPEQVPAMPQSPLRRRGFTLMEVIVAIALVAIMAGSLAPVVYKQVNAARSQRTSEEQERIKDALLRFYRDVGRFPSEAEGLRVLVEDPGDAAWDGPYLQTAHENPVVAVGRDAFGEDYVYDLNPQTSPTQPVSGIVASAGANLTFDSGSLNNEWDLDDMQDDLVALFYSAGVDRDHEDEIAHELEALSAACRDYYADFAAFPPDLDRLRGDYLDAGYGDDAFIDPWNNAYALYLFAGTPQLQLRVYSFGADQADDAGADDDRTVLVSSVAVGRERSTQEVAVSQAAIDAQPALVLTGDWSVDRVALGLGAGFEQDGWGTTYAVNATARYVYSAGSDANPLTTADNVPAGFGP